MGRLSATQIIDLALDMVGNPRIASVALSWLNLLLDETARSYRFPDIQKRYSGSLAASVDTVAYPSDYGFLVKDRESRAEGQFVPSDGTAPAQILLASLGGTRDSTSHIENQQGTPNRVSDDRINSQWILHPIPQVGGTLYLNYQAIPASVTMAQIPWYPSDTALVEAIAFLAERRQRGKLLQVNAAIKEAAKRLALVAPSRGQLWQGGSGSGLDPRIFR